MFRHSLQAKVFLTFLLFMFIMTALLLMNQRLVLLPVFSNIEEEFAHRDLDRIGQTIDQEKSALESTLFDWSAWDDTYSYVTDRDPAYEEANLDHATIDNLRLNLIVFYDRHGQVVLNRSYNLTDGSEMSFDSFPADATPRLEQLISFTDQSAPEALQSGFFLTEHGVLLVASRPILTSARGGPYRGVLVFGRLLRGHTLERLRQAAGAQFEILPTAVAAMPTTVGAPTDAEFDASGHLLRTHSEHLQAYKRLDDIEGNPTLLIKNQMSRQIFNAAFQILRKSFWLVVGGLLTLMLALMALVHVEVSKPVVRLSRHLNDLRISGNYGRPFMHRSRDEVGRLAQRFNELLARIAEQSTELRDLSYEDTLTQIANRRCFNDQLIKCWEEACKSHNPMSMIVCDLDYFKRFNDLYGHLVGDECLREVAQTLKRTANKKLDLVARFGGEEFVILLPETSLEDAIGVAERVLMEVEALQIEHARSPASRFVSVSVGVASTIPDAARSPDSLIRSADVALYRAKAGGRNRIVVDDGSLMPLRDEAVE